MGNMCGIVAYDMTP